MNEEELGILGTTSPYFAIQVSEEQKVYAKKIVEYSIANHPVTDIFANDPDGKRRQFEFRFTGSLGEIVFADAYQLPRPTRSFGAVDGQDFGQDFQLPYNGKLASIDVKSMHRKSNRFLENYVLNLPSYQLQKDISLTDFYFCISLHDYNGVTFASFLGLIDKRRVKNGEVGDFFVKGTTRVRQDNTTFRFMRDTYEIMFRHILAPPITPYIPSLPCFRKLYLLPVEQIIYIRTSITLGCVKIPKRLNISL